MRPFYQVGYQKSLLSLAVLVFMFLSNVLPCFGQNKIEFVQFKPKLIPPIIKAEVLVIDKTKVDTFKKKSDVPIQATLIATRLGDKPIVMLPATLPKEASPEKNYQALPVEFTGTDNDDKKLEFYLVYFVERALSFNKASKLYEGAISFYLQAKGSDSSNEELKEPVELSIHASDVNSINPNNISVSKLAEEQTVVFQDDHPVDSVRIRFKAPYLPENYFFSIPVNPKLSLPAETMSLEGFGVGKVPISVVLEGKGQAYKTNIVLNAQGGTVRPNQLELVGGVPQTVLFYSKGMKGGSLEARMPNQPLYALQFEYYFPWVFVLVAMLGGVLGAVVYGYRVAQTNKTGAKVQWRKYIPISVIWGVVSAVAFIFGINLVGPLTSVDLPFSEASVFLVSVLGGAFWSRFSDKGAEKPDGENA